MKFDFPLQKLLEMRKRAEDVARKAHLEAALAVDAANKELADLYEAVDMARKRAYQLQIENDQTKLDSLGLPRPGGLGQGPSLVATSDFVVGQKIRIDKQRLKIRELLTEAERLQGLLLEAAKERKALEKLRERRWNEFKDREKKLELRRVDELTTTRYPRLKEEAELNSRSRNGK